MNRAADSLPPFDGGVFTEILLEETAGLSRPREPVFVGLPLPRGFVTHLSEIGIRNEKGLDIPLQIHPVAHWSDGSPQWLHCDFFATLEAGQQVHYRFYKKVPKVGKIEPVRIVPALRVSDEGSRFLVDTGRLRLQIAKSGEFLPWEPFAAEKGEEASGSARMRLKAATHGVCRAELISVRLEENGPVKCVILSEGTFSSARGIFPLRFRARHHFFADSGLCKLEFLIHNPRAAKHAQSVWDLGDKHSLFFQDLSLHFSMDIRKSPRLLWKSQPGEKFRPTEKQGDWELFQGSSGGTHWRSSNHVNGNGEIPLPFQGCRILTGSQVESVDRATPVCRLDWGDGSLGLSIREFWQNFPKALRWDDSGFRAQFFPEQFGDAFEIQPGEKKSHLLFLQAGDGGEASPDMDWTHSPLIPVISPEWYAHTGVHPYMAETSKRDDSAYFSLMQAAIHGEKSFFTKQEIIDEYGWRNFGDVYADHESARNDPDKPFVSHYNNQYDFIHGAILQYSASGDPAWRRLADELARHVRDIDIYHTQEDRYEFNGGLFWHTNHYMDAATATHRCFSRRHFDQAASGYGGGPSPAHCYATGLLHHYFLTGERDSLQCARELMDYAKRLITGAPAARERWKTTARQAVKNTLALLKGNRLPDDLARPSRAAANVLSALLDGYHQSRDDKFLDLAYKLIRRCVSVQDNLDGMDLQDAEHNWSYLMFLQALGKFLDTLSEKGERGGKFEYAASTLRHYALWMTVNEKPFLSKPEALEFPTETWAATELRKTNVFLLAYKYGIPANDRIFLDKARFYHRRCFEDLSCFGDSAHFARPIAILMTNGLMYEYFKPLLAEDGGENPPASPHSPGT